MNLKKSCAFLGSRLPQYLISGPQSLIMTKVNTPIKRHTECLKMAIIKYKICMDVNKKCYPRLTFIGHWNADMDAKLETQNSKH